MKRLLLILFVLSIAFKITSQEVPVTAVVNGSDKSTVEQSEPADIKIFPVPVLEARFTITSDKPFIFIRMTNIIGQEVTRERFYYPRYRTEMTFNNAEKGIYLVTIEFEDNTKIVKKILVDTRQ